MDVATVVALHRGRVLLVAQPGGTALALPGGKREAGEAAAAAARRELREETGIALGAESLIDLGVVIAVPDGPSLRPFGVLDPPRPGAPRELRTRWIDIERLAGIPTLPGVARSVHAALAHFGQSQPLPERLFRLVGIAGRRAPVAQNPRPLRRAGLRGDEPADADRARARLLGTLDGPLADRRGARGRPARRVAARLAGTRLPAPCAGSSRRRAADRQRRLAGSRASQRAPRRRALHGGGDPLLRLRAAGAAARRQRPSRAGATVPRRPRGDRRFVAPVRRADGRRSRALSGPSALRRLPAARRLPRAARERRLGPGRAQPAPAGLCRVAARAPRGAAPRRARRRAAGGGGGSAGRRIAARRRAARHGAAGFSSRRRPVPASGSPYGGVVGGRGCPS